MPSISEKQRKFFRLVYNYKRGLTGNASMEIKDAANKLTLQQIKDFLVLKKS